MSDIIEQLRQALPPVFLGVNLDDLTGGAACWRTLQNQDCEGKVPKEIFLFSGRKKLIKRDPFLTWWQSTLTESRPGSVRAVKRKAA